MSQITAKLTSGMCVQLSNGRHQWRADEPVNASGTDTGPNPYEMLLGSLAACACMTIAWYCKLRKLPLESITAEFGFSRDHAEDCWDCDSDDIGFIETINSKVHIDGRFDDAQRKRLSQIVERCPVHKTLTHGLKFKESVTFFEAPSGNSCG